MMTKKCEHCGQEFSAKRNDAKFCNSTCRSMNWQNNNSTISDSENIQKQLKGVLNDNPASIKRIVTQLIPNKDYVDLATTIKAKKIEILRLQQQKLSFAKQFLSLQNLGNGGITLLGTGTGAAIGYNRSENLKNEPGKCLSNTINGGFWGFLGGFAFEQLTKDYREKQRQEDINQINVNLSDVNAKITNLNKDINELNDILAKTEPQLTIETEIIEKSEVNQDGLTINSIEMAEIRPQINVNKHLEEAVKTVNNDNNDGKIISSGQLVEMNYKALNFQGNWQHLFGFPSVNFHCVIHGMSGEGKSTFAIQFANYLANNFGKIIYISSEEGFSKTMKDKIVNNNASSENLFIADIRTYDDLVTEVRPNTYNFIIIDSLDNMRIGANEMKSLRKLYQHSAIITISQSTKDGKIRGSYEIVHDSDIAVCVTKGIAETTKNRFLEKGRKFKIFEIIAVRNEAMN